MTFVNPCAKLVFINLRKPCIFGWRRQCWHNFITVSRKITERVLEKKTSRSKTTCNHFSKARLQNEIYLHQNYFRQVIKCLSFKHCASCVTLRRKLQFKQAVWSEWLQVVIASVTSRYHTNLNCIERSNHWGHTTVLMGQSKTSRSSREVVH